MLKQFRMWTWHEACQVTQAASVRRARRLGGLAGRRFHGAIYDSSPVPDLNTVMATAPMYRLTPSQAQATLARLRKVLGAWEVKAKLLGLSAEDRLELKDCFQV